MEHSYKVYKSNTDQYASQYEADYELVSATLDAIAATGGANAEPAKSVKAYADRMYAASGAADCATMDEKFASKVAESANDLEILNSIVRLYRRMGCTESEVYFAAAESSHKLQPTAESAAGCAQMCIKKGDLDGAVEYYKQALAMEDVEKEDRADYLYRLANVYVSLKNYPQGVNYAKQALELEPEDGRCYLLMAICYGAARIYSDPVLQRSVFWVACDMCVKAKQVDPSCAADADKLYAKFRVHFPSRDDIFFSKDLNEGSAFTVGGWIGRTTIVRAR
jgi:tetratricopeptide (TPR) repeat protein